MHLDEKMLADYMLQLSLCCMQAIAFLLHYEFILLHYITSLYVAICYMHSGCVQLH